MSGRGVGNLPFIDGTMDKWGYLNVLKENLGQSAEKLGLQGSYYFQHDNDPKHTADIIKLWILYNIPKQLHTPPQSPDLNPIEHIWDLLEHRIQHHITSNEMLKEVLQLEWTKISREETRKLVQSMSKRLSEVLRRKEYPTSY
ncbi:Transposable element Tcb1 transposase [Anthophora retusa]